MIGELLSRLRDLDVRLWNDAGTLRYSAPSGALTPELLDQLRLHKAQILAALESARPVTGDRAPRIAPVPRHDGLPASFAQERLWFLDQMGVAGWSFNIPLHLRWHGPLEREALRKSVLDILRRHETLRTGFRNVGGRPVQVIEPAARFEPPAFAVLPVTDLTALDGPRREAEVRRLAVAENRRPFDLTRPPLFRARLLELDATEHVVLLVFHHIVTDAWSMGVFVDELSSLYDAHVAGRTPSLPEPPVQYADFASWQRRWLTDETLAPQIAYFREQLADVRPLELPADRPRPARPTFEGAGVSFRVRPEVASALRTLGRTHGATPFMTLLAAFQALLFRYAGQSRVPVGCPVANRTQSEVAGSIGLFNNALVFCTSFEGEPSFVEVLRRVREVTLGVQAREDLPFEKLVEALSPERDLSRHPLFQVWFVMQSLGEMVPRPADASVEVRLLEAGETAVRWDLELHMWEDGDGLGGVLLYSTELFERERLERMVRHFQTLLACVAAEPDRPIAALPLLGADERLAEGRRGARRGAYPAACLHDLFAAHAAARPDAVALVGAARADDDEAMAPCRMTYGELNARANRLAHHLRALGVGPESRVALCAHRSVPMVVGLLGILKAGGAYVPLDPAYPRERLAYLLDDARPDVVVIDRAAADTLSDHGGRLVDLDDPAIARRPSSDPVSGAGPANAAYVIYTSGSTGRPKGVPVTHENVSRLFASTDAWFAFSPDMVWSVFHSYAFDFSVWELWGALLHGGRAVVVPYWMSRSPSDFHALLGREGVTMLSQTPSAFRQLITADAARPADALALRHVVFGGEALAFESLAPWTERHGDERPRLVNMYGITETTVHVTYRPVTRADVGRGGSLIGAPLPDLELYVLDARREPVPEGVVGELLVGGAGVARGYLDRRALTAERFVPHPFRAGERLYRSGDMARRRGADIEYLGRRDAQVQLRGFRVELGEIETALRAHLAVADAIVEHRDDGARGARLLAWVVRSPAEAVGQHELRRHLADRLPDYMVPGTIVVLDALPLTAHGKLDRAALLAYEQLEPEDAAPAEPPRGQDEELLAELWESLLGVERIGRHVSFFELGGHSLLAMQLVSQLRDVFGVELSVRRLFEALTIASLAREIAAERRRGVALPPAIARLDSGEPPPLSFAQTRLWFIHRLEPESAAYNVPLAYRLVGALDVGALEAALREVVRRHTVLRTCIADVDGTPVPRVEPESGFALTIVGAGGGEPDTPWSRVASLAADEAARPFDLTREWPLRVTLVRRSGDEHALLITLHHIASDAWSQGLLIDELSAVYTDQTGGAPASLPALAIQYADYAAWQRRWLSGDTLAAHVAYWRTKLADLPALRLPLDFPRPARRGHAGAARGFELSRDLTARLAALCRERHVTPFMALLSAFAALLSRHGGGDDVAIGSPVANRGRTETERLIGVFVNTLVLRVDLSGDPTVGELLARVRGTALDAYAHGEVPFEKLVEELAPERDLGRNPLFQVSFTLQPPASVAPRWSLGDVTAEPLAPGRLTVRFDLELHMWEADGRLHGALIYGTDLFRAETIDRLVDRFQLLVAGMTAAPESRVASLPILTEAERAAVLRRGERRASHPGVCLHDLFAAQARARPDAIAVIDGAASSPPLTYRELAERSRQLAHRLRALGVGADSRVAIYVERSPAMVVGILGILEAGGAYVPIDPTYPDERVAALLADARPGALVTEEALRVRVPATFAAPVVSLDGDAIALAACPRHRLESGATPSSLAYVIYTSGSTGRPKGVEVTHENVSRLFTSAGEWFDFGPRMVWSLFHSYAFDFSVWELWGALLHGGRVVVVPYWVSRSPGEFLSLLRRERVSVLSQTPSAFRQLIAADEAAGAGEPLALTHVVFGGEALDFPMLGPWIARHGDETPRLVNMYGITETTVHVTFRRVTRADVTESRSLIGVPLPDLELLVLDEHGGLVPEGVAGELYVGGAGLARGYLGQEALTRERFVPHPFRPGRRLYRSGDAARWVAGDLEYLGRLDVQVQLRGFRVEPGEIEATLRAHPAVRDAVVLHRDDGPRGARLIAHAVVPAETAPDVDGAALRRWLAHRLPEHMVPASVVRLDALPLTSNGKLDRGALLALDDAVVDGSPHVDAPGAPDEELLAGIWTGLLGLPHVGARTNFFEAGGHSLLAAQLVSRIRNVFDVELPLRRVFEQPTLAGLAGAIRAARVGDRPSRWPDIARRTTPTDAVHPLSFGQQRIWFLDQLEGGSPTFNVPLALRLEGELRVDALERSLAALVQRHEALRTRVVVRDDVPGQVVTDGRDFRIRLIDLSALPDRLASRTASDRLRQEGRLAFDLTRDLPIRATLLRRGPAHHVLLLSLHHIATDGWSLPILLRELASLYAGFVSGTPAPLAELPIRYTDFAAWQREHLTAVALSGQLAYWKARLADAPATLEITPDRARSPIASSRGGIVDFAIGADLTRRLKGLAADAGATLFMTLCAAYATWLARQTGQSDLVIGTPIANRTRAEIEPLVGCFVNTLALRVDLSGDPSFAELLVRVRRLALEAYDHQDLPFERLVEALAPERRLHQTPLFQTMFDLTPGDVSSLALPGLALSGVPHTSATTKFDVSLSMTETADGLRGFWEYRADLFDETTVARWTRHLTTLLAGIAADPSRPVAALRQMSGGEAEAVARAAVNRRSEGVAPELVHRRFEDRARRAPDAIALVASAEQVSYGALDARANRLAHVLRREHGIGPDVVVGVLLDRSLDLVVSLLAVLKAGGAYLPLDPELPDGRLTSMLRASGAKAVLTRRDLAPRVRDAGVEILALDAAASRLATQPATEPAVELRPESLAYVIFTSGSTGTPKGVMITHGSLASFTGAAVAEYAISAGDRVLQFASPSFDTSGEEIYPCLASGGTLVLRTDAMSRSIPELLRACDDLELTVLDLPTAYWHRLAGELASGDTALPASVRLVIIGGERARPEALAEWAQAVSRVPRLVNTYGPTETTIVATASELSRPGIAALAEVPIGRPLAGVEAHLLDTRGTPAALGVPGEILIGGDGLARGYLGQPAQTAAQFVPSARASIPGARLYRSGDRARRLDDGELQYLGRIDAQTKIRGYRVEPGEIEAVLARQDGVREAVVLSRADASGDTRLIAYVVPSAVQTPAPLTVTLRAALVRTLPEYMVPASIVVLETWPLTPGGKVDRRALPDPDRETVAGLTDYVAPRTADETTLASLWAELLGLDKVGLDDNFFDLGGHSLALLALQRRLRQRLGHDVAVVDLFRFTTVRSLSDHLSGAKSDDAATQVSSRAERQRAAMRGFQRRGRGGEAAP